MKWSLVWILFRFLFLYLANGHIYSNITGSLYRFHRECRPYAEARQICLDEGGDLVVINSEEEADVLAKLFQKNPNHLMRDCIDVEFWPEAFIGVHYDTVEEQFLTITRVSLKEAGYEKWRKGEPNNVTEHTEGEQCVTMFRNKELNDLYCGKARVFICEFIDYEYNEIGSSIYKVELKRVKWAEASRRCERQGGHLAIIDSEQEGKVVGRLARKWTNSQLCLVGFKYDSVRKKYRTVHGDSIKIPARGIADYQRLQGDAGPESANECGAIDEYGVLRLVSCGQEMPYICEIDRNLHQYIDLDCGDTDCSASVTTTSEVNSTVPGESTVIMTETTPTSE